MERAQEDRADRLARRWEAAREELAACIARAVPQDGRVEQMAGLVFGRASAPQGPVHAVARPCLCVIAQGGKVVQLGERRYPYDPGHYLLITTPLPLLGYVRQASRERPYLSLRLDLDPSVVSAVMVEAGYTVPRPGADVRALDVHPLGMDLLEAVLRLARLVERPDEQSVLAPLITREIVYRLLRGDQGARLAHLAVLGGQEHRIARAVRRIQEAFDQPIPVARLARYVGMSVSGFHHHFKAVTGLTPLQFQKQLQLQEARRLLLAEGLDATTAGFRVGYRDASHFTREYRRFFGRPPMQDVKRLRAEGEPGGASPEPEAHRE